MTELVRNEREIDRDSKKAREMVDTIKEINGESE